MWGKPKKKVGRPTRDEAAAKAAAQRAKEAAERRSKIAAMELALREAELQVKIDELMSGRTRKVSEIEQMADTLAKLKAAGIIPKGKTAGEDDNGGTKELIAAFAPYLPAIMEQFGALRNTGPRALAGGEQPQPSPQPQPQHQPPPAQDRPPAFADAALSGAFAKRTPEGAAEWLWTNRAKWEMVRGVVESVVGLPDDQLPGYLDYLGQYFPVTVAWLQARPDWWGELVLVLRRKAAA